MKQATSDISNGLEDLLCFSVYSLGHAFNQLYRPLLADLGVTYPQYLVLTVLWTKGDQTVSDLGNALSLKSNTLTPLLKRLEVLEQVTRHRDEVDERVVRITLTQSGRDLKQKSKKIPDCILRASGLSVAELNH